MDAGEDQQGLFGQRFRYRMAVYLEPAGGEGDFGNAPEQGRDVVLDAGGHGDDPGLDVRGGLHQPVPVNGFVADMVDAGQHGGQDHRRGTQAGSPGNVGFQDDVPSGCQFRCHATDGFGQDVQVRMVGWHGFGDAGGPVGEPGVPRFRHECQPHPA